MNRLTVRLVLIVSCAHALVHAFEVALPSVEQLLAREYQVGRDVTGLLSTSWRLPWGFSALVAGLLVDRFGSRRMLVVYLVGCAAACGAVVFCQPLGGLFIIMPVMGAFASIYHPAGLTLISRETNAANRPFALGIHGVFGSLGIGASPFFAAILLRDGFQWRSYYALLAVAGIVCAAAFYWLTRGFRSTQPTTPTPQDDAEQHYVDWTSFYTLTLLAVLQGLVYSAVVTFLPRYLNGDASADAKEASLGVFMAGGVLLAGCVGQIVAGKIARPKILELQLGFITLANTPFLLWMALAPNVAHRLAAAACFSLVHFMHQPIYNSLIAKYTPPDRRSLCYGFSFAVGLGLGGFGAALAGFGASLFLTYAALSAATCLASLIGFYLWLRNRGKLPTA